MKKKLIATATPALALVGALALATPALADYNGAGQAPANANNGAGATFPNGSAEAPQVQFPLLPIGAIGLGVVLVGAGGLRLRRVDARRYSRRAS